MGVAVVVVEGEALPAPQDAPPPAEVVHEEDPAADGASSPVIKRAFLQRGHGRLASHRRTSAQAQGQEEKRSTTSKAVLQRQKRSSAQLRRGPTQGTPGAGRHQNREAPESTAAREGGAETAGGELLTWAGMSSLSVAGRKKVAAALQVEAAPRAAPGAYVDTQRGRASSALPQAHSEGERSSALLQKLGLATHRSRADSLVTPAPSAKRSKPGWNERFWVAVPAATSSMVPGIAGQWIQRGGPSTQQKRTADGRPLGSAGDMAALSGVQPRSRLQRLALAAETARRDYSRLQDKQARQREEEEDVEPEGPGLLAVPASGPGPLYASKGAVGGGVQLNQVSSARDSALGRTSAGVDAVSKTEHAQLQVELAQQRQQVQALLDSQEAQVRMQRQLLELIAQRGRQAKAQTNGLEKGSHDRAVATEAISPMQGAHKRPQESAFTLSEVTPDGDVLFSPQVTRRVARGTPLSSLLHRAGGLQRVLALAAYKVDNEAVRFVKAIHRQKGGGAGLQSIPVQGPATRAASGSGEVMLQSLEAELARETQLAEGLAELTEAVKAGSYRSGIARLEEHLTGSLQGQDADELRKSIRQLAEAQLGSREKSATAELAESQQHANTGLDRREKQHAAGATSAVSAHMHADRPAVLTMEGRQGAPEGGAHAESPAETGREVLPGEAPEQVRARREQGSQSEAVVASLVRQLSLPGGDQQRAAERASLYLRKLQEIEDLEDALHKKWLEQPLGDTDSPEAGHREGGAHETQEKTSEASGLWVPPVERQPGQTAKAREASRSDHSRAVLSRQKDEQQRAGKKVKHLSLAREASKAEQGEVTSFTQGGAIMADMLELSAEQLLDFCNTCVDQMVDTEFRTPPVTPRTTLGFAHSSRATGCTA